MRHVWLPAAAFLFSACEMSDPNNTVVSKEFVHKYGFNLSENEWQTRDKEGQVITKLENGVKICTSYENGELHGPTTYSFPHSDLTEKLLVYDRGTLLRKVMHDRSGLPLNEETYEFDQRMILTQWSLQGVPLSIEEYQEGVLLQGKYFNEDHELEAKVLDGTGNRVQRDKEGTLLSHDQMEQGILTARTSYHPNGQVHTVSHYDQYQLHGKQLKYSDVGRPLLIANWDHGTLDGTKVIYRNGYKIKEVPYIQGKRHGTETHFDDLGNLIAEIAWTDDVRHGVSRYYSEETQDTHWFYKGQGVTAQRFEILEQRENMIAEINALEEPSLEGTFQ